MLISEGLVGPKGMTKVGPDGQMVNIPSLVFGAMGRRRVVCRVLDWMSARCVRVGSRKIQSPVFNNDLSAAKIVRFGG